MSKDAIVSKDATESRIVDEDYDPGVPGRACLDCNSAWPATEADDAYWHHRDGCAQAVRS